MITKLTVALKIGADTEPFSHSLGPKRRFAASQRYVRNWGIADMPRSLNRRGCGSRVPLFDHLVGEREQRRRHVDAERLRGLEIEHELEFGGLNHGKIGRLGALED